MQTIIDDERGALVEYLPDFLDTGEREALRSELEAARGRFDRDRLTMYGRVSESPRLVCAFGDEGLRYRYAGVDRPTHPWPVRLREARDRVADLVGHPFDYALVNLYRDGNDYIGWHADKVADLEPGSCIASLSLGAERPFQLRDKAGRGDLREILLADGSLLLMRGATQRYYKHQLPARRGVANARFNVTLRHLRGRA